MAKYLLFIIIMCISSISPSDYNGFTVGENATIAASKDSVMNILISNNDADLTFLRQKAVDMTCDMLNAEEYEVLKKRMLVTVQDPNNPGVGLAAPQVGISRKLIVVQRFDKDDEPFEFYVNPEIISYSAEKASGMEGCLSVRNTSGLVDRSTEIIIRYNDEKSFAKKRRDHIRFYSCDIPA